MTKFRLLEEGENPTTVPLEPERANSWIWFVIGALFLATGVCALSYFGVIG